MTDLRNMPLREDLADERNAREWMGKHYDGSDVQRDIEARRDTLFGRTNVVRPTFGKRAA